jgi:hypothetical protein
MMNSAFLRDKDIFSHVLSLYRMNMHFFEYLYAIHSGKFYFYIDIAILIINIAPAIIGFVTSFLHSSP